MLRVVGWLFAAAWGAGIGFGVAWVYDNHVRDPCVRVHEACAEIAKSPSRFKGLMACGVLAFRQPTREECRELAPLLEDYLQR